MTEDEAKMKWCPMARSMITRTSPYGGISVAGVNRWSDGQSQCKGSGCMAWRWGGSSDFEAFRKPDGSTLWITTVGQFDEAMANPELHRLGYCGLAGKP